MQCEQKHLRVILRGVLVTALVYLVFRYLLSLVFPFLAAYLLAGLVRPFVGWLHQRFRIPGGIGAALSLGGLMAGGGALIWWGGRILAQQAAALAHRLPVWMSWCEGCLMRMCRRIEEGIALEPGSLVYQTKAWMTSTGKRLSQEGATYVVEHVPELFQGVVRGGIVLAVIFFASVLFLSGEEARRRRMRTWPFPRERELLQERLRLLGRTYIRCEFLSMVLTCLICGIGLWVIGNPYALLLGILIGVLDALPLFGTGTVLIPWALVCFLGREYWQGAVLLLTYGVGYGVHQLLETHMLGDSMGTTPLFTLAALYVGMELFGLAGLVLGPVGWVLIREILALWEQTPGSCSECPKNREKT